MTRRPRISLAAALMLCATLAAGIGALLVPVPGSAVQDVGLEHSASPEESAPLQSTLDGRPVAAREVGLGGVEFHAARDQLAVLERDSSAEPARAVAVLPAGLLEVSVRSSGRAALGTVALQPIRSNDLATPFDRSLTIEAPLVDGVARFADLPRGVLLVAVQVGSGPALRTTWVNSRVRGARLEFELGDAGIHGWVRDNDGAAVAGARVWITGQQGTVVATSAADGSYDGGRALPAGRWSVHVEGHPIALASPRRCLDLQPNSVREISFGPGGDCARWTGRLLAPDGSSVSAADGWPPNALQLVAQEGRGAALDVRVVDGAIDQWFERGVYQLRVVGDSAPQRSSPVGDLLARPAGLRLRGALRAPAVLDLSADLARDVQLAGFVLCGRLAIAGSDATGSATPFVELRAERASESLQAEVSTAGTFRFLALKPGTYELRAWNGREAAVVIDEHGPILVEIEIGRN